MMTLNEKQIAEIEKAARRDAEQGTFQGQEYTECFGFDDARTMCYEAAYAASRPVIIAEVK